MREFFFKYQIGYRVGIVDKQPQKVLKLYKVQDQERYLKVVLQP